MINVLPSVERATLFHPNGLETPAAFKRIFSYFPERAGKRHLINLAILETFSSDALNPVRNLDASEPFAGPERLVFESPQRGWKANAFYRAALEGPFLTLFPIAGFLRA